MTVNPCDRPLVAFKHLTDTGFTVKEENEPIYICNLNISKQQAIKWPQTIDDLEFYGLLNSIE